MDAERWQKIADLIADTLERPAAERSSFLARTCSGDAELRDEVQAYLDEAEDSGFLARPIFSFEVLGADPNLGRRLGGYRLDSLLGRGGMGSVYRASRVDGPFEREVAIKLLRRGLDSDEILRRFRAEQRMLAQLEHPGIARLIDGDTAEDGSPFFVLELVEGQPIDVYCRERRLPLAQRVELLAKVCEGVGEAHRHLVVHRDLKNVNVLVNQDGQPKLLDFGIAKWLSEDAPELTAGRAVGPMTPEWASPEQRSGGVITTATDIYSLGLLGYVLLTGRLPKVEGEDGAAHEPALPSLSRLQAGAAEELDWHRQLAGDLDTILAKALKVDPADRYATVEDFADDLRRYLDGRPVKARPDSFLYVATRLARRHALATAAFAAALLVIFAFAGLMTWQRQRIARQASEISQERDRAQATLGFLVDFLRSPDPSRAKGENLTVREALVAAEAQLDRDLHKEPAVRAELYGAVGDVYRNLALYDEARKPLESALALRRAENPGGEEYANALHDLALLERHLGNLERSVALTREALGIERSLWPDGHADLARGINNFASLLLELGQITEAEALAREGLAMKEAQPTPNLTDISVSLNTLATILRKRRELGEAEALYRRCLDLRRRELPPLDPQLPKAINNLAGVLKEQGRLEEAAALYEEALALRRKIFPQGDHPDVLTSLNNLAMLEKERGHLDVAEKLLREAVLAARRGQAPRQLPTLEKNLGAVLIAAGRREECLTLVPAHCSPPQPTSL